MNSFISLKGFLLIIALIFQDTFKVLPGQSQSPVGSFARTSILPYLKANEYTVLIRALFMGLSIFDDVPVLEHPHDNALVHLKIEIELKLPNNLICC